MGQCLQVLGVRFLMPFLFLWVCRAWVERVDFPLTFTWRGYTWLWSLEGQEEKNQRKGPRTLASTFVPFCMPLLEETILHHIPYSPRKEGKDKELPCINIENEHGRPETLRHCAEHATQA